jgi:hypothetical protein
VIEIRQKSKLLNSKEDILVPKLCLGTDTVKLRFIQEAELQKYVLPSWSLGARRSSNLFLGQGKNGC